MRKAKQVEQPLTGGVIDCCSDEYFTILHADDAWYHFIGYTKEEFVDKFHNRLFSILLAEDEQLHREIRKQLSYGDVFMCESQLTCKDKTIKWVSISAQLTHSNDHTTSFHCIFHDISREKKNEQALQLSDKRLAFLLSLTQDIVFEYDVTAKEIYYSENFERKFGYQIPVTGFPDSLFEANIIYQEDVSTLRDAFQSILHGKDAMRCEYRLKYQDKGYRWVVAQARALRDQSGKVMKILGVIKDIHEQKNEILKSRKEAALDPLTGLYNRRECVRRIEEYISKHEQLMAFILIDVDDFKLVNDRYGHTIGDETLFFLGEALQKLIRKKDTAARIGGDEFVVCLNAIPHEDVVITKIKAIQQMFSHHMMQKLHHEVNCSIGVSYYPKHGKSFHQLLEAADRAMYQAKKEGKNRYSVYQSKKEQHSYAILNQPSITKTFLDDAMVQFMADFVLDGMIGWYVKEGFPFYYINDNMLKLLGYEDEKTYREAVNGHFLETIFAKDRFKTEQSIREQLQTKQEFLVSFRICDRFNQVIWISGKGKRIHHSEEQDAVFMLCVNIQKQKACENQLNLYQSFRGSAVFIITLDAAFTLCYANASFYELLEITPQQMQDTYHMQWIRILQQDDRKRIKKLLQTAKKQEESTIKCEFSVTTGKGNQKWLFLSGALEQDEHQQWQMKGVMLDHTREHTLMEALTHKELVYRTALEEAQICVWEYDIDKKIMYMSENGKDRHAMQPITCNMPEELRKQNLIHPESWPTLKDMYVQLENGVPYIQRDILTANKNHDGWWWERVTYTTIYDQQKKARYAVAVGEDVTKQKTAQAYYQHQMQRHIVISDAMLLRFRMNLTQECMMEIEGKMVDSYDTVESFEDLLQLHTQHVAFEEDRLRFLHLLNMEALQNAYAQGKSLINCEYRCKDEDGHLFWVNSVGRLFMDAKSGDLYLHGILVNIDDRKKIELALKKKPEMDVFPNVYKENTFKEVLKEALKLPNQAHEKEAFLLFEIDHESEFSRIDMAGVERIQEELAALLLTGFACRKIVGRMEDGTFALWLCSEATKQDICAIVEYIRKTIGIPYMFSDMNFKVTLSCGIILLHQPKTSDELFHIAFDTIHQAKEKGGNCYVLKEVEQPLPQPLTMQELFTGDKASEDMLLKTLYSMNLEKSFTRALYRAVEQLMRYYGGDRAYLIDYSDTMQLYEVRKDGMDSIKELNEYMLQPNSINNANLKELLFGVQVLEDVESLKDQDPKIYAYLKELRIHSSMLACMQDNGVIIGYLGIDNYTCHKEHPGFLRMLSYYLSNELAKMKLQKKQLYMHYHDYLSGALNRASYQQYRQELMEERLISLGVVSLDINGLRDINHLYGNAYGDDIIRRIAHVMEKIFVNGNVYRFTGDEFLVIVEDMSNEMFTNHVVKLQKRMQKICDVSIGFVWSDTNKQLDELIAHADEQRLINKQFNYSCLQGEHTKHNTHVLKGILKEIKEGRFQVYLQKKVNSQTNAIIGGEALIRYQDADGTIVAPNRFIPMLEKLGIIHYIDFFVFRQVHEILCKWEKEGKACVPISLNFSRVTLLEDNLAQRMSNISKSYACKRAWIEIEITESVGDIERTTMEKKCKEIKEAGYRLSLDDFGSKYSNIAFLSSVKFNVLKLDKGLMDDIISNHKARAIISSMVELCAALQIEVVAEGVEYAEQVEILKTLGCYLIQGYYYGKPIPSQEW